MFAELDHDMNDDIDDGSMPVREYRENCSKCKGQGRFISYSGRLVGQCFACKGVGYKTRKTAPEARAKATAQRATRKAKTEAETLAFFASQRPEIAAWIDAAREGFAFAQAMREAVVKFGDLTEKQLAACQKCIDARQAARAKKVERVANAPTIETKGLMAAFDTAKANGLASPKMRFDGFSASLAKPDSANAGAIYLKAGETYLGKIVAGRFLASRECRPENVEAVQAAMADPLAQAIAYGRKTGT